MATDVERLLVRLEVTQRKFERQLATANRTVDQRARSMERRFVMANRHIGRSFDRMAHSASNALNTVATLAIAAAASLGTREVIRYADAWTRVENQIKAAVQISGTQARTTSRLNDIANETRSGLEETANLYARMLRVSGDLGASEEQVAQATRTVTQAFKAGGAAASEQASAVLQLSQALSSGELMGEELRSLRENAPLLAQAIADEFETTIGGLKELGAEGELTSDRVFGAILNGQQKIAAAFKTTQPTISEGFTALTNGFTELVGAFDDGARASEAIVERFRNMNDGMTSNIAAVRRFGAQFSEAMEIIGDAADAINAAIWGTDSAFQEVAGLAADHLSTIVDVFQTIISEGSGVAALLSAAMKGAVDAVARGAVSIANGAISAVESILQGVVDGVNKMINAVNSLIQKANGVAGTGIPELDTMGDVSLGRATPPSRNGESPAEAYKNARDSVRGRLEELEDQAVGIIDRVKHAGRGRLSGPAGGPPNPGGQPGQDGGSGLGSGSGAGGGTGGTGGSGGGGSSSGGGAGVTQTPFFQDIERERQNLERQIEMIGMTKAEVAKLEAQYKLLDEAKERGLDLDARQAETGETLRQQIDRQAESVGRLTERYEQAQERAQFYEDIQGRLKDGMVDAIVEGENFAGVLEDVAKMLAKAALQAALFGDGPMGGGGGGGLLSGIFSAIGGAFGGGGSGGVVIPPQLQQFTHRATGGTVKAGSPYWTGENGPEPFFPAVNGRILSTAQAQQAMRGGGSDGGVQVSFSPTIDARGADQAAVERLAVELQKTKQEIPGMVVSTLKSTGNRGVTRKVVR